ncbi:MAG TPA: hypothetical protein VJI32_01035 [Candidatus Nanoarchaeia archaeon]|nr:hypothetical protein [Candidatus Nanoarchaeia archaeon]
MRNLEQPQHTEIFRDLLVGKPLSEAVINPGMKILYAQGQPNGQISIEVADVAKAIDGRLKFGTRAFRGVLPTGEEGVYNFVLNHKLEVVGGPIEDRFLTAIYDKDRTINSDDVISVGYAGGVFTFQFINSYVGDADISERPHVLEAEGIKVITRKDPRGVRFDVPGNTIVPDGDTLEHITNDDGSSWKVVQRTPDGPAGSFDTLGYRQIPDEVHRRMFGY